MTLVLLLSCASALAAAPQLEVLFADTPIDVPIEGQADNFIISYAGSSYDIFFFWEEDGELHYDNSSKGATSNETWFVKPDGRGRSAEDWKNVGVEPWVCYVNGDFGKFAVDYYISYIEKDGEPYVRVSLNPWETDEDGNWYEVELDEEDRFLTQNKDAMENIIDQEGKKDDQGSSKPAVVAYPANWYPHNTICVAGIEFRDVKPEVTSKWYNFAAIDLSRDGVQVYDLVASNMFVIGKVTVTKQGDEVVVDWALNHQGTNDSNFQLEDEFLTIFSSLSAVNEVEPDRFEGPTYEFGQPISIADDLNGDTNVLLYIRNMATYCDNLAYKHLKPIYHARYYSDTNVRIAQRNAMAVLMDADQMP